MPVTSGSTFSGYSILRSLGRGDAGEVFLAQHPRLPQWTALKILSAELAADDEFRDRFLRETPIATSLYHPHILRAEHRGEAEGVLWIAMDYVNGTDARDQVAHRYPDGMPAGEVLAVVTAIADALDYAHGKGLVHRNVKPANILFSNPAEGEQRTLLTDFGVARQLDGPGGHGTAALTGETVAFAAPEQLTSARVDGRADQYSLAATAYYLLTGAPPFRQSNPVAVIGQHLTAPPPSLRDRRPDLARLDAALAVGLAKNPSDRFASCRAFADALSHGAGAWTGDRSPEAYLTVVDYPDDDPATSRVSSATQGSESFFPDWAKTVRGLAQHHRSAEEQSAAERPVPPEPQRRSRWPWVAAASAAAAALAVGLVAVGVLIGRDDNNGPARTVALAPVPAPKPAPPAPTRHDFPVAGEALDGSYRIDVNREQQSYNGNPDPQPPNVTTWWAFRTTCSQASCSATGLMLDENGHSQPAESGLAKTIVLDFRNGRWQSRPDTLPFACLGPDDAQAKQMTTQSLWLQKDQANFRGTMTVTVETNECKQQGATIEIPSVAARVAEVPPGVDVPEPPASAAPAPGGPRPPR